MNQEIINEAFKQIDKEIMASPMTHDELEEIRKLLLFKVLFIESMMTRTVAA